MEARGPKIITSIYALLTCIYYFNPLPQALPPDLGKLARISAERANKVGFPQACTEARAPPRTQTPN